MHLNVSTEEILNPSAGSAFQELSVCFLVQPKQSKSLCFLATFPLQSFLICKQQATGNKATTLFSCCSLPCTSLWLLLNRPLVILVLKESAFGGPGHNWTQLLNFPKNATLVYGQYNSWLSSRGTPLSLKLMSSPKPGCT